MASDISFQLEQEQIAIRGMTSHEGWKYLKHWLEEEEKLRIEKMLRARKEETFRDRQGEVRMIRKILGYVSGLAHPEA